MKIAILSMQRIKNNGSFLQAYGLYEIVKRFGHDVEFIDFNNELEAKKISPKEGGYAKRILRHVKHSILPRYRKINRAKKNNGIFRDSITQYQTLLGLDNTLILPGSKHYDLLIIGSDEVFNICQFSDGKANIPWSLLGEKINANAIISYAASCGQTTVKELELIREKEHAARLLGQFSALSVRDANTYELVKELTGNSPAVHVDPVLLFENFPTDESFVVPDFKYLMVYAYTLRMENKAEMMEVKKFARSNNLKILCVNCFQSWCDVQVIASPFAVLQYVKHAAYMVTDTFHGTVFSIRCNVPFCTFIRNGNKSKLLYLLHQFGLEDRIVNGLDIGTVMKRRIDFDKINGKLRVERDQAMAYLQKWLCVNP